MLIDMGIHLKNFSKVALCQEKTKIVPLFLPITLQPGKLQFSGRLKLTSPWFSGLRLGSALTAAPNCGSKLAAAH